MTLNEAVALLREASESVNFHALSSGFPHLYNLRKRINAALAESQVGVECPECAKCLDSMEGAVETADLLEVELRDARAEIERLKTALAERQNSATVVMEPEPPLTLRKGDKVEVRVTRAEEAPPVTFSIGDPPLEVDPDDVWVMRFCDLVGGDASTEEGRLQAFAWMYDYIKVAKMAAAKGSLK